MTLEELRKSIVSANSHIYLNTGWAGPSPPQVLLKIKETLEKGAQMGLGSMKWIDLAEEAAENARRAIAALLNVDAEDLLLTHSTKEAVNVILYGLNWEPGDELLICDLEHIALTIPAEVLAERHGIRVVSPLIPVQAAQSEILEIVKRAITSRTRLVALSHIQFSCGLRMPIGDIARLLCERGIPILVDGAQSVGQIRVDIRALECDFYTLSGQKWLLGPIGAGALYVKRKHRTELEPILTTHGVETRRLESSDPLARFSLASNNPALFAGLTTAVQLAMDIGIDLIEQRIMMLADRLRKNLHSIPGSLVSPVSGDLASGLVTVRLNDWPPIELVKALQTRFGIVARYVDYPSGVRFSVSHFNNENEVEAATTAIKQLARERQGSP